MPHQPDIANELASPANELKAALAGLSNPAQDAIQPNGQDDLGKTGFFDADNFDKFVVCNAESDDPWCNVGNQWNTHYELTGRGAVGEPDHAGYVSKDEIIGAPEHLHELIRHKYNESHKTSNWDFSDGTPEHGWKWVDHPDHGVHALEHIHDPDDTYGENNYVSHYDVLEDLHPDADWADDMVSGVMTDNGMVSQFAHGPTDPHILEQLKRYHPDAHQGPVNDLGINMRWAKTAWVNEPMPLKALPDVSLVLDGTPAIQMADGFYMVDGVGQHDDVALHFGLKPDEHTIYWWVEDGRWHRHDEPENNKHWNFGKTAASPGTRCVRLKDGSVVSDPMATSHYKLCLAQNIDPQAVEACGYLAEGGPVWFDEGGWGEDDYSVFAASSLRSLSAVVTPEGCTPWRAGVHGKGLIEGDTRMEWAVDNQGEPSHSEVYPDEDMTVSSFYLISPEGQRQDWSSGFTFAGTDTWEDEGGPALPDPEPTPDIDDPLVRPNPDDLEPVDPDAISYANLSDTASKAHDIAHDPDTTSDPDTVDSVPIPHPTPPSPPTYSNTPLPDPGLSTPVTPHLSPANGKGYATPSAQSPSIMHELREAYSAHRLGFVTPEVHELGQGSTGREDRQDSEGTGDRGESRPSIKGFLVSEIVDKEARNQNVKSSISLQGGLQKKIRARLKEGTPAPFNPGAGALVLRDGRTFWWEGFDIHHLDVMNYLGVAIGDVEVFGKAGPDGVVHDLGRKWYENENSKTKWRFGSAWDVQDSPVRVEDSYLAEAAQDYTHSPWVGDEKTHTIWLGTPGVHHHDLMMRHLPGKSLNDVAFGAITDGRAHGGANVTPEMGEAIVDHTGVDMGVGWNAEDEDWHFGAIEPPNIVEMTHEETYPYDEEGDIGDFGHRFLNRRPYTWHEETNEVRLGPPGAFHGNLYDFDEEPDGYGVVFNFGEEGWRVGQLNGIPDHVEEAVSQHTGIPRRGNQEWRFASALPPYAPWEPGTHGKGTFIDDEPHMWQVDDYGSPHHHDITYDLHPDGSAQPRGFFHIDPEGTVEAEGTGDKHEFADTDPRLNTGDGGWKFGYDESGLNMANLEHTVPYGDEYGWQPGTRGKAVYLEDRDKWVAWGEGMGVHHNDIFDEMGTHYDIDNCYLIDPDGHVRKLDPDREPHGWRFGSHNRNASEGQVFVTSKGIQLHDGSEQWFDPSKTRTHVEYMMENDIHPDQVKDYMHKNNRGEVEYLRSTYGGFWDDVYKREMKLGSHTPDPGTVKVPRRYTPWTPGVWGKGMRSAVSSEIYGWATTDGNGGPHHFQACQALGLSTTAIVQYVIEPDGKWTLADAVPMDWRFDQGPKVSSNDDWSKNEDGSWNPPAYTNILAPLTPGSYGKAIARRDNGEVYAWHVRDGEPHHEDVAQDKLGLPFEYVIPWIITPEGKWFLADEAPQGWRFAWTEERACWENAEPWVPGEYGKGYYDLDGKLHLWRADDNEYDPHHYDCPHLLADMNKDDEASMGRTFTVTEQGEIKPSMWSHRREHLLPYDEIIAKDPRLKKDPYAKPNNQFTFASAENKTVVPQLKPNNMHGEARPWTLGTKGKGFIHNGVPYLWRAEGGYDPHHPDVMLQVEPRYNDTGIVKFADGIYVVGPDGKVEPSAWGDSDAEKFAALHPDLHAGSGDFHFGAQVPDDLGEWEPGTYGKGWYHPEHGIKTWPQNDAHHYAVLGTLGWDREESTALRILPSGALSGWLGKLTPEQEQEVIAKDPRFQPYKEPDWHFGSADWAAYKPQSDKVWAYDGDNGKGVFLKGYRPLFWATDEYGQPGHDNYGFTFGQLDGGWRTSFHIMDGVAYCWNPDTWGDLHKESLIEAGLTPADEKAGFRFGADEENPHGFEEDPGIQNKYEHWEPGSPGKAIWHPETNRLWAWKTYDRGTPHHYELIYESPEMNKVKDEDHYDGTWQHFNINEQGHAQTWRGSKPEGLSHHWPMFTAVPKNEFRFASDQPIEVVDASLNSPEESEHWGDANHSDDPQAYNDTTGSFYYSPEQRKVWWGNGFTHHRDIHKRYDIPGDADGGLYGAGEHHWYGDDEHYEEVMGALANHFGDDPSDFSEAQWKFGRQPVEPTGDVPELGEHGVQRGLVLFNGKTIAWNCDETGYPYHAVYMAEHDIHPVDVEHYIWRDVNNAEWKDWTGTQDFDDWTTDDKPQGGWRFAFAESSDRTSEMVNKTAEVTTVPWEPGKPGKAAVYGHADNEGVVIWGCDDMGEPHHYDVLRDVGNFMPVEIDPDGAAYQYYGEDVLDSVIAKDPRIFRKNKDDHKFASWAMEPWEEGSFGKWFVDHDGNATIWSTGTNPDGHPHHNEAGEQLGVSLLDPQSGESNVPDVGWIDDTGHVTSLEDDEGCIALVERAIGVEAGGGGYKFAANDSEPTEAETPVEATIKPDLAMEALTGKLDALTDIVTALATTKQAQVEPEKPGMIYEDHDGNPAGASFYNPEFKERDDIRKALHGHFDIPWNEESDDEWKFGATGAIQNGGHTIVPGWGRDREPKTTVPWELGKMGKGILLDDTVHLWSHFNETDHTQNFDPHHDGIFDHLRGEYQESGPKNFKEHYQDYTDAPKFYVGSDGVIDHSDVRWQAGDKGSIIEHVVGLHPDLRRNDGGDWKFGAAKLADKELRKRDRRPFSHWWDRKKPVTPQDAKTLAEYAFGAGLSEDEATKFIDKHKDEIHGSVTNFKQRFFERYRRIN